MTFTIPYEVILITLGIIWFVWSVTFILDAVKRKYGSGIVAILGVWFNLVYPIILLVVLANYVLKGE